MLNINKFKLRDYSNFVIYIMFILLLLLFSVLLFDKGFLTVNNLMNIAKQSATISIMAIGMTFVLCSGEIDLSIGSNVSLSALITTVLLRDYNIYIAILGGISIGALVGFINGLLVTKVKIPSFLATLGMMSILLGISRWISGLKSIPVTNKVYNFIFGIGRIGNISILLIWTIVALIIGQLVLKKTPFGRKVLATGGNKLAAIYTGIKVDRIKIETLMISGITASLAGMIYAGRLQGARYTLGGADLLTVIAATIIGGTSLFGGEGTVIGSVIGAFILGMVNNGLILLGLSIDQQIIARGFIIILAVSFSISED